MSGVETPSAPSSAIEGNGLAVLTNKCAARTFDISSGMVYASMRDQVVRAQLLVRDLKRSDPECRRVLIVGAGLAGVTAAVHASALGIEAVVVESKAQAFHLQADVTTRVVGPFMYEWPNVECQAQSYPGVAPTLGPPSPRTPTWSSQRPLSASSLAAQLRNWLDEELQAPDAPHFVYNVAADLTRQFVEKFVEAAASGGVTPLPKVPFSSPDPQGFTPDYIILAVGMGKERVHLLDDKPDGMRGLPFWCDDDLRNSSISGLDVAVFGAGDGALQDVLRTLTKHEHPLSFVEELESGANSIASQIDEVRPQLASLEQQSRLYATWSIGAVYDLIDEQCEQICNQLADKAGVPARVLAELRDGNGCVHHIYREQRFTRAYLLNRFCVHLIDACQRKAGTSTKMRYVRHKGAVAISVVPKSDPVVQGEGGEIILSDGCKLQPNRLVVRFGPDKDWLEKTQIVRLTPDAHEDRIRTAAIPLPYVVSDFATGPQAPAPS